MINRPLRLSLGATGRFKALALTVVVFLLAATPAMTLAQAPERSSVPLHDSIYGPEDAEVFHEVSSLFQQVEDPGLFARAEGSFVERPVLASSLIIPENAAGALSGVFGLTGHPESLDPPLLLDGQSSLSAEIQRFYANHGLEIQGEGHWEQTRALESALEPAFAAALASLVRALTDHDEMVRGLWESSSLPPMGEGDRMDHDGLGPMYLDSDYRVPDQWIDEEGVEWILEWMTKEAQQMIGASAMRVASAADWVAVTAQYQESDHDEGYLFEDPYRLVLVGGEGPDTYEGNTVPDMPGWDPVFNLLTVDLGGDDVYRNNAGGAGNWPATCPATGDCHWAAAASVSIDLGGNDLYEAPRLATPSQGAGAYGAVGILVNRGGDNEYRVQGSIEEAPSNYIVPFHAVTTQGTGLLGGIGLLLDIEGNDIYEVEVTHEGHEPVVSRAIYDSVIVAAQGASLAAVGVFIDGAGDDSYRVDLQCDSLGEVGKACSANILAQGANRYTLLRSVQPYVKFPALHGTAGVFLDGGAGEDRYTLSVGSQNYIDPDKIGGITPTPWAQIWAQGFADGQFRGIHEPVHDAPPAYGVFFDGGGDDEKVLETRTAGNQGKRGQFNLQAYVTIIKGLGYGSFQGKGLHWSNGGDNEYRLIGSSMGDNSENVAIVFAFGLGVAKGTGVFLAMEGNDTYESVFNLAPDEDHHPLGDVSFWGFGAASGQRGTLGLFLDRQGDDEYRFILGDWNEGQHLWVDIFAFGWGRTVLPYGAAGAWVGGDCAGVFMGLGGEDRFAVEGVDEDDFFMYRPNAFGHGEFCWGMYNAIGGRNDYDGFPGHSNKDGVTFKAPNGVRVESSEPSIPGGD